MTRRRFLLDAVAATGCLVAAGLWVAGTPPAPPPPPPAASPTVCVKPSPAATDVPLSGDSVGPDFTPTPDGQAVAPDFSLPMPGEMVAPTYPAGGR